MSSRDLEMLGLDGFDMYGGLLKAAGDLGKAGLDLYETKQAEEKAKQAAAAASAQEKARLQAAITADAVWAAAQAQVLTSEALARSAPDGKAKSDAVAKAAADQAAADVAAAAQDTAASEVPPALAGKRVQAAVEALAEATKKLQAAPTSVYAQNLVKAWDKVRLKAQNTQIVKAPDMPLVRPSPNWFMRPVVGPVPGWGVVAGGVGVLGLVALAGRAVVRRFASR